MKLINKTVSIFLRLYPIKSDTPYKFVPLFFLLGAGLEWVMIKFPGAGQGETFYDVLRRKKSERNYQSRLQLEALNRFQESVQEEKFELSKAEK